MSNLFWLTDKQMARIRPFFPKRLEAVGDMGVFAWIMEGLAPEAAVSKPVAIDATYLKAHRRTTSLRAKKGAPTTRGRSSRLPRTTPASAQGRKAISVPCQGFAWFCYHGALIG